MTPNWREVPFVRIILPFIAGILFSLLASPVPFAWIGFGSCLVLLLVLALVRIDYRYRWIFGFVANVALFLAGSMLTHSHDDRRQVDFLGNKVKKEQQIIIGHLVEPPKIGKNTKVTLAVTQIGDENKGESASGKMILYLSPKEDIGELSYGDGIIAKAYINPIPANTNPNAFDYKAYLAHKEIYYQAFVKEKWAKIPNTHFNPILKATYSLRSKLINRLRTSLPTANEFAVAAALVLGYREELSDEVSNAYSGTGAMHVLAVSGLHVGLVYLFLNFLLGLLPGRLGRRLLKPVVLLLGIWGFALLTGSSASVMRAATMFSFLIVGMATRRSANIYNTLASSAFLLLCFDPNLILDVSFQLSYSALIGIVYFQPRIYRLWPITNYVGDRIWALVTVSIAAQLGTLPISLYYFHQFPLLFWLSGIVVVPMAMLLLPLGLAVLACHGIPVLGFYLGKILFWLLWLMNSYIFFLQQVPGSLLTGIWIGLGMAVLLYLALIFLSLMFDTGKAKLGLAGIFCLVLVAGIWAFDRTDQLDQKEIIFAQLSKGMAIDFIEGKNAYSLQSDSLPEKSLTFALGSHREAIGIKKVAELAIKDSLETNNFYKEGRFIQFYQKKIIIIDQPVQITTKEKIQVDYVLISNKPRLKIKDLLTWLDCKMILFDGTNGFYPIKKWQEECKELGQPCWNLREAAFVVDLE